MADMGLSEDCCVFEHKGLKFEALGAIKNYLRKILFWNTHRRRSRFFFCCLRQYGNRNAGEALTPKEHDIEDHSSCAMREFKALYLLNEEGDESFHHGIRGAAVPETRSIRDPKGRVRADLRIFEEKNSDMRNLKKRAARPHPCEGFRRRRFEIRMNQIQAR